MRALCPGNHDPEASDRPHPCGPGAAGRHTALHDHSEQRRGRQRCGNRRGPRRLDPCEHGLQSRQSDDRRSPADRLRTERQGQYLRQPRDRCTVPVGRRRECGNGRYSGRRNNRHCDVRSHRQRGHPELSCGNQHHEYGHRELHGCDIEDQRLAVVDREYPVPTTDRRFVDQKDDRQQPGRRRTVTQLHARRHQQRPKYGN